MIICKTPFRVSFLGGGTDLLPWINYYGKGHVISTTINKYGYIFFREIDNLYNYNYKIRYYLNETSNNINNIKHPVIKHGLKFYNIKNKRLHITYDGELPSRSGLGTSSSFTVGFINSIYSFKNKKINKLNLAKEAIYFEHNILKEHSGLQDQIAVSFGGLNYIKFKPNSFNVRKLKISENKIKTLSNSLYLCFVPGSRNSSEIEEKNKKNIFKNKNIYDEIFQITSEALNELKSNKTSWFDNFNFYINEYWKLKKKLNKKVSNQTVNHLCKSFIDDGAYSAKLLGAGSNGFISIMASNSIKKKLFKKYKNLKFINVDIENNGSNIYKV